MNYPEPMVTISLKEYNNLKEAKAKLEGQTTKGTIPINSKIVLTDGYGAPQGHFKVVARNLSDVRGHEFTLSGNTGVAKLLIVFPE